MKTDNTILKLKANIASKKAELEQSKKFAPITNCSLDIDDHRYNLHTLEQDQLIHLLVKIDSYCRSAEELDLLEVYRISGFLATDWIEDLENKLAHVNRTTELRKLKAMEQRLTELLSGEKKVELEVAEISAMLND